MTDEKNNVIYLKDYQASDFLIRKTYLRFELEDNKTTVQSRLLIERNGRNDASAIVLNGEHLTLQDVSLNGQQLQKDEFEVSSTMLTIPVAEDMHQFELLIVTTICPEENTALEGLYRSRGMYCTQCEAEGFRRITYYLDRPDVLSEFETTIVAPEGKFPVMLSNGNCIKDSVEGGVRTVVWHDPHLKPCYLFALVAGDLVYLEDTFTTMRGRDVVIKIYVEPKDLDKCAHAMDSLKRSMKWDEEVYGREYDLDIFMIVAVDDFNMGAMENKGLNIFNTSCVLAHPKTTTDLGFERVEAVVAHEYFHNWSGNRVTCRDWFQLSLKEGFTVFRDSEFSADMNSRPVKRIEDVRFLRSVQFAEDSGPLAHAVRPESYMEISNFYTVTIYEKGAEVVRMLANLLGQEDFRKATDLYFERFDGQAVTCEDFVSSMEAASGKDLKQFRLWYSQAGTPVVYVEDSYDEAQQCYTLTLKQTVPDTPGQTDKLPMQIPFKVSLLGDAGALPLKLSGELPDPETSDNTEMVLDFNQHEQVFQFEGVQEKPVPSLLRSFSAPVKLRYDYTEEQLNFLIQKETDGFNCWDATQSYMLKIILDSLDAGSLNLESVARLSDSLAAVLDSAQFDNSLLSYLLVLPEETVIVDLLETYNPSAVASVVRSFKKQLAIELEKILWSVYQGALHSDKGSQEHDDVGNRALANACLGLLMGLGKESYLQAARQQFETAKCMTMQAAALKMLVNYGSDEDKTHSLDRFIQQWKQEALVVNMWLQIQASADVSATFDNVVELFNSEYFDVTNPNKIRALISGFCMQNPANFHREDGKAYFWLADQIIALDKRNPQIASRLVTPLTRWQKLEPVRQKAMISALEKIASECESKDVTEVVLKSLSK